MMSASLLLTGAFHEDGFADVCDGFGGGRTRDAVLSIMKDSRVGAYGAIGNRHDAGPEMVDPGIPSACDISPPS